VGWYLNLDLTNPLFSDKRVRQAMNHAIDRQAIVDAIFSGSAEPSVSVASPLSWIYNPNAPKFEYNADRAKALLNDAGWLPAADGIRAKDGRQLAFTMNTTTRRKEWALSFQPMLKNVGIQMNIDIMEFGTWLARLKPGSYEAALNGWSNFEADPREDLQSQFQSPRANDTTGYKNDRVDQLFDQALTATNREDEKKIYDEIQQITGDEAIYVYLFRPKDLVAVRQPLTVPPLQTAGELYVTVAQWELRP
jgi:peptide/nickel transport system substrate-binding protein